MRVKKSRLGASLPFHKGDQVVCVGNPERPYQRLCEGAVYTVRLIKQRRGCAEPNVWLHHVRNARNDTSEDVGYCARFFAPYVSLLVTDTETIWE
jgi:hypothetical protein